MPKNKKIVVFLIVLLIVSLVIWKYQQKSAVEQISSFEECARAGYPVLESYPEQCRTPNGESFTRQIPNQQNLQQETVEEIGLSFQYPTDLLYRKEIADNDVIFVL